MEAMLNNIFSTLGSYLSNYILIVALLGGGIWFTVKLGFIQVKGFGEGMRRTFGGMFKKGDKAGADGMSSFQALATAIAAQVGTGNIAGAATALAIGVRERSSGCGSRHSLEWLRSMPRRSWHRSIKRSAMTAK